MKRAAYPSVVDRYFTKFYNRGHNKEQCEDLCVLAHSNKICLVTLSPKHQALAEGDIQKVEFTLHGNDISNLDAPSGKKKINAVNMKPGTSFCTVTSGAGKQYIIRSGIKGKLMEINKSLLTDPSLVSKKPDTLGYLAVILHQFQQKNPEAKTCSNLMTEVQYQHYCLTGEQPNFNPDKKNWYNSDAFKEKVNASEAATKAAEDDKQENKAPADSNSNVTDSTSEPTANSSLTPQTTATEQNTMTADKTIEGTPHDAEDAPSDAKRSRTEAD